MGKALNLDDSQYQWLLTIFYIPYITFEWMALMWEARAATLVGILHCPSLVSCYWLLFLNCLCLVLIKPK